ncbi:MAG: Hpt domain-containing protein [Desulfobacterales bacterium]|nr:Hpt domain-containing protein [Desulfobacterales bacterium]
MDFKALGSRLGIDEEDFMELVELFITTTLDDIEKIRQGLTDNNPVDAAAAAHSIKGAAGNLGLDDIYSLSKKMEEQAKSGSLDQFDVHIKNLEIKVNALASIADDH